MLKLPQIHTDDEKANAIIAWYLNRNILQLVQDIIINYEAIYDKEAREDDPDFQYEVGIFFPEHYPAERTGKVFLGLRALLESEYEFVPELAMEYVMYALIQTRIELADDAGVETQEPIPYQRDYVANVLRETYPDRQDVSDCGEDIVITWQDKLRQLEDLHEYEDVYFWDMDYLELEFYTEEELSASPVCEFLGIGNIGEQNKKFVIPPEWLK